MANNFVDFRPLNIAVLTVSDSRTRETDTSGDFLSAAVTGAEHHLVDRQLRPDNRYHLRACVSQWIADSNVNAVVITGGTGLTACDGTPEAIAPLLDKQIEGFGELFRTLSYGDIGTATLQSRALAGVANRTLIFCVPGSTNACKTAWNQIIAKQLDARTRPCNLVALLPRL